MVFLAFLKASPAEESVDKGFGGGDDLWAGAFEAKPAGKENGGCFPLQPNAAVLGEGREELLLHPIAVVGCHAGDAAGIDAEDAVIVKQDAAAAGGADGVVPLLGSGLAGALV